MPMVTNHNKYYLESLDNDPKVHFRNSVFGNGWCNVPDNFWAHQV